MEDKASADVAGDYGPSNNNSKKPIETPSGGKDKKRHRPKATDESSVGWSSKPDASVINISPTQPDKAMAATTDVAVRLKDAFKHYGHGKSRLPVLLGLNMEVERGQIYGLLGPSGCGKTTLLKCIVGQLVLDSGSVRVFGSEPGPQSKSGVPGSRVGYMPQELALFGEFTITETLQYFARLYGMTDKLFRERMDFLIDFLDLPSKSRALIKMSGGQQRRASLAVALLHEPELLILDEPTVGVDPLLRASIWKHLVKMSEPGDNRKATTIVITTHYIEEARQANRVGMMRFGKLLAEGSPDILLQRYGMSNLEDVFLELCRQDGDLETTRVREHRKSRPPILVEKKSPERTKSPLLPKGVEDDVKIVQNGKITKSSDDLSNKESFQNPASKYTKVKACVLKTFNRMKKRIGFLIFQFVLPALQVSLFCSAIGQDPKDLSVAVVNAENNGLPCDFNSTATECPISFGTFGLPEPNEHLGNFTCRYLSFLDKDIMSPVYYDNVEEAMQSVVDGYSWGVVQISANFSQNLYNRIFESMASPDLKNVDLDVLNGSSVRVRMDITNQHIAYTLQLKFAMAFESFVKQLIASCGLHEDLASIPLVFDEPIYGHHELTFTDFMAPGIILTIVHSMALGYSAIIIIMERNEGLLDRTWVAGVTPGEFALAHFLVSLVVNFVQVVVTLVFMILVFQVPAEGSMFWIFLLTMMQGVCGTTIGLIISVLCKTQLDATQVAQGIFYPNLIMSGVIWPVESMPTVLRYFAYTLPQTFACEAMRGILLRGWGMSYMPVWRGFVVTLAWIAVTYAIFKRLVMKRH